MLERHPGNFKNKTIMNTNYSVGDFLIRIKNAAMAGNKVVTVKSNTKLVAIAEAFKKMGFVDKIENNKGILTISLTFKNKMPRLTNLKLVSKPGLRIYMGVEELEEKKGPSIYLVSTPKGVVSSLKAIKDRVGGEVIAEIW